jgi:hypothetical protein
LLPAACQPHLCDPVGLVDFSDGGAPLGHAVGDDAWETNAVADPWVSFPGQSELGLHFPMFADREIVSMVPYVSFDQNPMDPAGQGIPNWSIGSGNNTEFRDSTPGYLIVRNDTCTQFYLRVVLEFGPREGGVDAGVGTDGEAGIEGGDASGE